MGANASEAGGLSFLLSNPADADTAQPLRLNRMLGFVPQPTGLLVRGQGRSRLLEAPGAIALVRALQAQPAAAPLAGPCREAGLEELLEAGIVYRASALPDEAEQYWLWQGIAPATALARLQRRPVKVNGDWPALDAALARLGCSFDQQGWPLGIVRDRAQFAAASTGGPELRLLFEERQVWYGPFCSASGVCLPCALDEWRAVGATGFSMAIGDTPATIVEMAAGMVAADIVRALVTGSAPLRHSLMRIDLARLEREVEALTMHCSCACGERSEDEIFSPRVRAPEPESLVSTQLGPIWHIEDVATEFEPCHVAAAAFLYPGESSWQYAWGRGLSPAAARRSAAAEAIERRSTCYRRRHPLLRQLRSEEAARHGQVLLPNEFMCFSDAQLRDGPRFDGPMARRVPLPVANDTRLDWHRCRSLVDGMPYCVPAELVYFGMEPFSGTCIVDSSGVAAGATLKAATEHAFLELVERDAMAAWWYGGRTAAPVDDEGLPPDAQAIHAACRRHGLRLRCLALAPDLGVPVFAAALQDPEDQLFVGGCARWNAAQAIIGALTEAVQKYLLSRYIALEDGFPGAADCPLPHPAPRGARDAGGQAAALAGAFAQDPAAALRAFSERYLDGTPVFVIDLTDPGCGLPVARVMIPRMGLHWPRYGPGRLRAAFDTNGAGRMPLRFTPY